MKLNFSKNYFCDILYICAPNKLKINPYKGVYLIEIVNTSKTVHIMIICVYTYVYEVIYLHKYIWGL